MNFHPLRALTLATVIVCATPQFAQAENTVEQRIAAAERYVATMDYASNMKNMAAQFSQQLPPEVRETFILKMASRDYTDMTQRMVKLMAQTFSADELNAMSDFYSSAEWKSAQAKMGEFSSKMSHITNTEITDVMAEISAK